MGVGTGGGYWGGDGGWGWGRRWEWGGGGRGVGAAKVTMKSLRYGRLLHAVSGTLDIRMAKTKSPAPRLIPKQHVHATDWGVRHTPPCSSLVLSWKTQSLANGRREFLSGSGNPKGINHVCVSLMTSIFFSFFPFLFFVFVCLFCFVLFSNFSFFFPFCCCC